MRLTLFLCLLSFNCFGQDTLSITGTTSELSSHTVNNSISFSGNKYVLKLGSKEFNFKDLTELKKGLRKQRQKIAKDSLYVLINDSVTYSLSEIPKILRGLKIKYTLLVTNDFFALPYPKKDK